ncbi:exodeoxyribonuclease VII large subunit [Edaphobacter bradus]|uniref:exodeoxyribonuclease VII large subunit n=1 Tax=Edaphobacter bradus TaxID=2259016 RepID=UPI0021DF7418|nr:exodeoxyribonuclease VII large subunit [Edaphobacter bradus]
MPPKGDKPGDKPPTLASLRASRGRQRSAARTATSSSQHSESLQTDFLFEAYEQTPEPPPPPPVSPAVPAAPALPTERLIWTVHDLVSRIRLHVETTYSDLWVEGEISNCRSAPSGHIYFTLKDGEAQLPVVLFRRQASLLRFRPADGLAVLVRGRISVYESRGQLQLIAETLEPRGAGALQLAFEQLKARLLAEGLFDAARKRPLPAFPQRVGIVTSPTGAVIRDIVTVVRRRHARLNLLVYPATMQGSSCPGSVAEGIRWFNRHSSLVDLILIARGGGSLEDLAGFNDEALARVIAASGLPIVSAIGHETDFTIADFVADLRAPTPSAAAELITAAQHRIEERLEALDLRARRAVSFQLIEAHRRYARLSAESVLRRLRDSIGGRVQRLDELDLRRDAAAQRRLRAPTQRLAALTDRLRHQDVTLRAAASRRRLERSTSRLDHLASQLTAERRNRLSAASARLHALSPLNVLARGYALVYAADGTLLRSAADTAPGRTIRARLSQGSLEAQVTDTKLTEKSTT